MIRNVNGLTADTRVKVERWVELCMARGVEVLVYCTRRTLEEQAALYASGRTVPGPVKTNAKPGYSWHNYGRAVDAVPMVDGKPDWSYSENEIHWRVMIEEGDRVGLEWAGRWKTFKEFVHWQFVPPGLTYDQARAQQEA